ncbi:MAG TPA: hypothetical protein PK635_16550, partial [Actinomycetota bacterium]|nr:hypothetical protein [Actinomycetota bacterium]
SWIMTSTPGYALTSSDSLEELDMGGGSTVEIAFDLSAPDAVPHSRGHVPAAGVQPQDVADRPVAFEVLVDQPQRRQK